MKITEALKEELALWLDTFWKTYMKGDYDRWATFVANDYYNIGGTKEEIWHSKREILEYSYALQDQMVDQAEIRNRKIEVLPYGDYVMVNEFTEMYVKAGEEWIFYGDFRMSSLMEKTKTGWIVQHQHGSFPDMKAAEGEAFGLDAVKAENERLKKSVEERTAELVTKNRELEIEAALEKVRAVAMGMKTSDDMLLICRIIAEQLATFGIDQIRNVQTAIIESDQKIYLCYQYFPSYDQDIIERTEYLKNPVEQQMVDQMLAARDSHFLGALTGEELVDFGLHRKEENHLADPLLDTAEELGFCFLSIGEGGLGLTLYRALDEESLSLFKRFHQVFSLAYQRFRDIQKAEGQAREAEIELALERVRARTMAMHNSSELAEASILLDQQVRSLGIQTWGCAFHIYADNEEGDYEWFSSANGSLPFYKTPREKFFLDFYDRGQRGEKFYVKEFAGEECKAHYDYLKTIPIAGDSLKALEESGISLPTYQIDHIAFFKHGYVLFITYEAVSEAYEIFQRFAKVFEQTYTRFLDLQKAEAQAREAQIETSLERVRSRSLAMHATSDLQEVIHAVHQELIKLDIGIFGGSFIVINSEIKEEIHCWGAGGTADTSDEVHIPYFDKPFYTNLVKGLKSGPSFFTEEFTQEEKKEFFTFLFTKEPWSNLKANEKKEILSSPGGYTRSCSVSLHTSIFIINQLGNKFSEKENDILKRFGKVFEQSYTRFLDLQKAEAQAREAQIEAAIERVRAQSMAMHHPDDLDKVNKEILAQLKWLQIEGLTGVTFYLIDENGWVKAWDFSNPGNTGDQSSYTLQFDSNKHEMLGFPFKTLRQSDLDYFVADYPREKLEKAVYEFDEINPAIAKIVREALSTGILTHQWTACCRISNGLLGIDLVNPPKKDTEAIVMKMAGAFNQAYTRFLDLQKAEAQTREAQVNLAVERVRAKALAMFKSEEILEVVNKLKEEIMGLDIPNVAAATIHLKEPDGSCRTWDLTSIETEHNDLHLPLDIRFRLEETHPDFFMRRIWENEADYFVVIQKALDFKHTLQWLRDNQHPNQADEAEAFFKSTQLKQAYHPTVPLNKGRMNLDLLDTPTPEVESILKKMAGAFDLAYKRFEDLQKAEAQTKEARIEAALEKVRSRSLAMHKSDELKEVVSVLFERLKELQIPFSAIGIGIYIEGSKDLDSYVCGENEAGLVITNYRLPYFENQIPKDLYNALEKQLDFYVGHYSKEEKDAFYNYVIEHTAEFRHLPEDIKRMIFDSTNYTISMVAVKNAVFNVNDFEGKVLAEEEVEIIQRFARVFDQAYTRFLDLQKAENQAREAQIEAALERIRSRSLAMYKTDDLGEVVAVLFEQMQGLSVDMGFASVSIFIFDEGFRTITQWIPLPDGVTSLNVPYFDHPISSDLFDAKEKGADYFAKVYTIEEKNDWLKAGFEITDYKNFPEEFKTSLLEAPGYALSITLAKNSGICIPSFEGKLPSPEDVAIMKRVGKVFEQAYVRFLDLKKAEAQAREAQIEAALERVRSRSLAMHHSSELSAVVDTLLREFTNLEFTLTFCIINLIDGEDLSNTVYAANPETGKDAESYYMKFEDYDFHRAMWDAWKAQDKRFVYTLEGEEKKKYDEYLYTDTEFRRFPKHVQEANKALDRYVAGFTFFKHSGLQTVSVNEITEVDLALLERFGKVFEQAYTRFLDLQKAEAQAREAEVELALERVRARTMAMQHSDELMETSELMFEQIKNLGIELWSCGFSLWYDDDSYFLGYNPGPHGKLGNPLKIPLTEDIFFTTIREAKRRGDEFFVFESEGESLVETYRYMDGLPVVGETMRGFVEAGFPLPTFQVTHCGFFSNGHLMFITQEPNSEAVEIFKRFTKVFNQTYTRFLDLQKAEAQTKEARIEAALERVRSRSLAMHKSEELEEVILVVSEQLQQLQFRFHNVSFGLDAEQMGLKFWLATPGLPKPLLLNVPYLDNPGFTRPLQARNDGVNFSSDILTREENKQFLQHLLDHSEPGSLKAKSINFLLDSPGFARSQCLMKNTILTIGNYNLIPYSEDENAILKRFGNVFEQAYTRFLDLQKAEEQAKEAKIEAALEKVRSRTLAMQSSDELAETAAVLFAQLIHLGVKHERINIGIVSEDQKTVEFWSTEQGGNIIKTSFTGRVEEPLVLNKLYLAWKNREESISIVLEGEKLSNWISYCEIELGIPFDKSLLGKQRVQTAAFFSKGMLMLTTPDSPPTDTSEVLIRFAAVFNLTFTRFNDLKIAEANALRAEEDLEKLKASKARAEQALKELKAAQEQLVQQEKLASLGQLTAGIAHEIKNPLNFVNNFSDLSRELIEEVFAELENLEASATKEEIIAILQDVQGNLTKVHEHGTRADSIVTSMLQHSRASGSKREAKAFNPLVKEFVNLSYHGMRAGKAPINVDIDLQLDLKVGDVTLISEDFSRVILNLCNNAFDAMRDKLKTEERTQETEDGGRDTKVYLPKLTVKTTRQKDKVILSIGDNGGGIPEDIRDKILQPFFTTKKGTEGTGLGLSITHDIVKAHRGEIKIESKPGDGASFLISLPIS